MQLLSNIFWVIVAIPLFLVGLIVVACFGMIVIAVVRCIWGLFF